MPNTLMNIQAVREALTREAQTLPRGYDTLATLDREVVLNYVDHPDKVMVQLGRYKVTLPDVNAAGYFVYDRFWLLRSQVTVNEEDPDFDPTQPGSRVMTFGLPLSDQIVCENMRHGEHLFVTYERDGGLPRCLMLLFIDPAEG